MCRKELEKFKSAMKKKEFRDLLVDYVKEIQDPENKKASYDLLSLLLWSGILTCACCF